MSRSLLLDVIHELMCLQLAYNLRSPSSHSKQCLVGVHLLCNFNIKAGMQGALFLQGRQFGLVFFELSLFWHEMLLKNVLKRDLHANRQTIKMVNFLMFSNFNCMGPVVQSIVSLTSSFRGQLVTYI